jgi:acetoin utilization deacetylase AcuC-like enzyme
MFRLRERTERNNDRSNRKTRDMSTAIYSHPDCQRHEMGEWHPESPARLQAIQDQLILAHIDGLLDQREAPLAQMSDIERNHSKIAIDLIRDNAPKRVGDYYSIDGDTLLNAYSWKAALRAAGAAVAATDAVLDGQIENAFCAVRPPGHHARPSEAMGFCLFNNIAIAAKHALHVRGLERVAIVDFDVHHGNGTAESFADDPRVLTVPARSKGDVVRQLVLEQWLPALQGHRPQMIFISAGFDAHCEDDMGNMGLVEADYAWMTQQIMLVAKQFAQGRIVSCLEGGYNLSALGRSVVAHVKVLAGLD